MKKTLQPTKSIGDLLRFWRQQNRQSQMDLALDIGISTRHLSFVETGKSQPSRDLVVDMGEALKLPYRQQNTLLIAAGYAPQFKESNLDSEALKFVNEALQNLLNNHNPFPALVLNSRYDILMHNMGFQTFISHYVQSAVLQKCQNALELFFAENGLKPHIKNWDVVAPLLLARVHEEAMSSQDPYLFELLEKIDVRLDSTLCHSIVDYGLPMLALEIEKEGNIGRFFTTIATIGTPLDMMTQELRLEMLYPADDETKQLFEVS